jgi:hypothetical protein
MSYTPSRPRVGLAALVAALALLLVGAGAAQAAYVKLEGSSTVTPSPQATQFLADNGVTVEPSGSATADNGSFTFPIFAGFGNTRTYNGVLAHSGGLRFSTEERSAVVRRFVAVRVGATSVLLAQVPGLPGGCGHLKRALRHFLANHPGVRAELWRLALNYPRKARHVVQALRRYCQDGRVIVLADMINLGKSVSNGTATLSADLVLTRESARLLNRLVGSKAVGAGAPLGSAVSTVTPAQ